MKYPKYLQEAAKQYKLKKARQAVAIHEKTGKSWKFVAERMQVTYKTICDWRVALKNEELKKQSESGVIINDTNIT